MIIIRLYTGQLMLYASTSNLVSLDHNGFYITDDSIWMFLLIAIECLVRTSMYITIYKMFQVALPISPANIASDCYTHEICSHQSTHKTHRALSSTRRLNSIVALTNPAKHQFILNNIALNETPQTSTPGIVFGIHHMRLWVYNTAADREHPIPSR